MSVPGTYTEADVEKARQCISQVPCAVVIDTRSMGLPSDKGSSLSLDIKQIAAIKGATFGGGIITATVESGKIPNSAAWYKFYDDLIDTISKKCAHRIAVERMAKAKLRS